MANVLKKLVIDECSLVDKAANHGAKVVIMKRHGEPEPTPAAAYQTLMKRARGMADRVAKSGAVQKLSVEQCFTKLLVDPANRELAKLAMKAGSAPPPAPEAPPPAPTNAAFEKMMKRARRAAAADPSLSVHQHFAKIAEADPQLFQKAKAPPKKGEQVADPEDADDGDLPEASLDFEDDDDDDDDDGIGPGPDCDAVSHGDRADGYLKPRAYNRDGDNLLQAPRPAVTGKPEGSYDPTRRPASVRRQPPAWVQESTMKARRKTERGALSEKEARLYKKFLRRSPRGTHNDAMWYARATKEQRQRYKVARDAA